MMRLSLRFKLVLALLGAGLIPVITTNTYTSWSSSSALETQAVDKLIAVRNIKGAAIQRYFETINSQVLTFANGIMIKEAMAGFAQAFTQHWAQNGYSPIDLAAQKHALAEFYRAQFGARYKESSGESIDTGSLMAKLSDNSISLQHDYIVANSNSLGSKQLMDRAEDKSTYSDVHAKYHPSIRNLVGEFGYYDIFLVDADTGMVVYSVSKETDFGTSLLTGPYAESNFADAFKKARNLEGTRQAVLVDYEQYTPSYEAPASFIAAPIWDNGKKIGVAVFQMPIDRLNAIMEERSGMGETGETFMVGSDKLMRSDSHLDAQGHSIAAAFKNPEDSKLDSVAVAQALEGNSGYTFAQDYRGEQAIVAYAPLDILGQQKWALIAKIDQDEAFASVDSLSLAINIIVGIFCVINVLLSFWLATSLSKRIRTSASRLREMAAEVSDFSENVASHGEELSSATTEQAANLQETVTSIDEISSMVQRNADAANNSTRVSSKSTDAANRGKKTVEDMIASINDIAASNEDIRSEMQRNNQEIAKIVNVIAEIGTKTKIINDIVFQTKLLSFNASVEAARAGEHGKGFAVVAEEVGNLAAMSGKAALEITEMLDSSTKQVTGIVDNTKEKVEQLVEIAKNKVDAGTQTANDCGAALDEILQNVMSVNEMTKDIATASMEQAAGVKEVTSAMQQLDQTTHKNTLVSQQASANAAKLKIQAEEMTEAVRHLFAIVDGAKAALQEESVDAPSDDSENSEEKSKVQNVVELSQKKPAHIPQTVMKTTSQLQEVPNTNHPRFEDL